MTLPNKVKWSEIPAVPKRGGSVVHGLDRWSRAIFEVRYFGKTVATYTWSESDKAFIRD